MQELPKEVLRVKCEPEFGHRVLTGRIKPFLEKYQQSGNSTNQDREVCSELLRALEISDKVNSTGELPVATHAQRECCNKARPKTVMAVGCELGDQEPPEDDPLTLRYATTYKTFFKPVEGQRLTDVTRPFTPKRPLSSYPYTASYNIGDPIGTTTYDREFNRMANRYTKEREHPIRTGSTTGNRRNNPHPLESFMVWRFPRERSAHDSATKRVPANTGRYFPANEDVEQIYSPLKMSTYRTDYDKTAVAAMTIRVAELQGKPIALDGDDGSKLRPVSSAPYTLNTTQRASYQPIVNVNNVLRTSTTRYGSNSAKLHIPRGITPNVSEVRLNLKTRTHYDQEVNDLAVNVYEELSSRSTIPHGKCVKRPPSTIMPGIPVDSS